METNPPESLTPDKLSIASRIGWAILILATLYVCYFSHLGAIGFVGPDEPRYAWIARDMTETGDWVTPRLYGQPWFEKPPLFYWGAALSFKVFGVSEAAARLPSAISALLATLAMAWLAWRLYGAETARWLLLLLPTTVGMIGFSHAAATDMPFSAMLTIAMVFAAVVLGLTRNENSPIIPRTPWAALLLFGFFLSLAVLAKGPAAIILCGGAVSFWAFFTKRWRDAFRLLHPAAIATFCATALPWYILCAHRNPDFLRIFIIEHNFKRYLTPEFQHIQPFWFYGPILIIAVFPWSALFLCTAGAVVVDGLYGKKFSSLTIFFASWVGFCLAFFSISKSKLPGYLVPAIPPAGLCLAAGLLRSAPLRRKTFGWVVLAVGVALFLVGEFAGSIRIPSVRDSTTVLFAILCVFLALALPNVLLGLALLVSKERRFQSGFIAAGIVGLVFSVFFADRILGDLDPIYWGQKNLALQLIAHGVPPERVYTSARVDRSTRYAISFYLRQEILDWKETRDEDAYVISLDCRFFNDNGRACEEVPLSPSRWSVVHIRPSTQ